MAEQQYIFVHGLGQNASSWNKVVSLMPESFSIDCPDLTIFCDGRINYTNLYRNFSNYCNEFTKPLNLCGLSLGGIFALNYALDNPEKVQSLVLIGTQYKMPKTLLKLQNIVFRIIPKSAFKGIGFQKHDFIKLTNSMINLDFSERISSINCPTLILCGKKDSANKKASEGLAASIMDAKFQLVENAGHQINADNPEELASIIRTFASSL